VGYLMTVGSCPCGKRYKLVATGRGEKYQAADIQLVEKESQWTCKNRYPAELTQELAAEILADFDLDHKRQTTEATQPGHQGRTYIAYSTADLDAEEIHDLKLCLEFAFRRSELPEDIEADTGDRDRRGGAHAGTAAAGGDGVDPPEPEIDWSGF
jgi:hypothetical protein